MLILYKHVTVTTNVTTQEIAENKWGRYILNSAGWFNCWLPVC